ncbi:MAG: type II CRISPR RNA-guided endonuclease Cas9 [Alphaproteobacteria bacterium]|nr:type II CRISPR RNA-guided endonuclease Cas9 [Alphaproteobacteria bacterium]
MSLRLSIDLGSTSLGWNLFETQKDRVVGLKDLGVRIFSDGRDSKSKEPLAVTRRQARGMRRNLDRRKWRRQLLLSFLVEIGLMPKEESERKKLEALDPYEWRAKAIKEKIPAHHLGRVFFHINQRRGFKSNRKVDKGENDVGAMKIAMRDLDGKLLLTNSKTLGDYFAKLHANKEPVRVHRTGIGNKATYNFYTTREMYEKEVITILAEQRKHHEFLTEGVCQKLIHIIFFQRPLRPAVVGKCTFEHDELRARLALPIVQKFRTLQEVNNLAVENFGDGNIELTLGDKKKILAALLSKKALTFKGMRRMLKLGDSVKLNLESDKREELKGDSTAYALSNNKAFGDKWVRLSEEEKEHIVTMIFEEQDSEKLQNHLMEKHNLKPENAEFVSEINLVEGYGRLSKKAIQKMLPYLEEGDVYADAAQKAGYHHSDTRTGEVFDLLPYYGEILPNQVIGGTGAEEDKDNPERYFGKINNPTVHIALNQVQKLVNAIIASYGKPDEVVIELARDLKEPADEINKDQAKNAKDNKRINAELEKLGVKQNYRNRMLFKLWEDLAQDPKLRCCPFSGIQISAADIFSGKFEEEHLLPFSRSFNDGRSNKVLSHIDWNRRKGNRSPYEAFGHEAFWTEILARAQNLPSNKRWRFKEDAWAQAEGKDGAIARLLNDTRYMSRLAKDYLSAVFDNEKGKSKVWATTGQMTALLRDKYGLNNLLGEDDNIKERGDHRHHAIDAFVIGLSDRGTMHMLSEAANRMETTDGLWEKRRKLVEKLDDPFPQFRESLRERLEKIVVSYKPDHGNAQKAVRAALPYTVAPLHEQTALGYIRLGDKKGAYLMATRVPLDSIVKRKDIEEIANSCIREALLTATKDLKEGEVEWKKAIADYAAQTGTKKVRVHTERKIKALIGIKKTPQESPYKYYVTGGNYCAEIFCPNKGEQAGKWQCKVISNFDAHQKSFIPQWKCDHPTAKLVMRLQIDDMVAYEKDGKTVICRVKKITRTDSGGVIYLRPHLIAKEEADKLSWGSSASSMQAANTRKISVDIIGRVRDPQKMAAKG